VTTINILQSDRYINGSEKLADVNGRSALMFPAPHSIGYGSRQSIRRSDQYRTQNQGSAETDFTKDEKLRDHIEKNGYGNQVTNGCDCAAQQFSPSFFVKDERPQKGVETGTGILHSTSCA
jgi:hypothetical protein